MKQISEEDERILVGNKKMRDNPKSSKMQIIIANTVIWDIVNKYCAEEINKVIEECFPSTSKYFNNFCPNDIIEIK